MSTAAAHASSVNLIQNGSFESGIDTQSTGIGFVTVPGGDNSSINNWTVGGDSVDYIGSYWQPFDGARSIDLSGNNPGSLSQSFSTVAGQTYSVSFYLAGNPDGAPTIKPVSVTVAPTFTTLSVEDPVFTFDVTGHSRTNMGWVKEQFDFVGTGGSETLTFASNTGTAYGPALDLVSVSSVPLPASLPMFGAALLALTGFSYGMNRWVAPKSRKTAPAA
ncbi:choice-of-anchor C family protein [Lichenifustis flavocetrariae]|uniref:Choice-of-anchor C family protein n=1 Tax=Lichenifustis flavocetrariae TaxID=2949735 RepID=A0AA41Z3Q8_9HYPH|nr:choice-of-anchor C family protein [Lichenifustis flavocetrariae]MCW6512502.1 choice-of-anchor C family protein [Lichenifustis flavocetrariae]